MSDPTTPELPRLSDGAVSRTQVETRMLDIPLTAEDITLIVRPGQTAAVPKMLKVVERTSATTQAQNLTEGHAPFVRLHMERYTQRGSRTRVGDQSVDIHTLAHWVNGTGAYADRRDRWNMPRAARIFEEATVADLVRLSSQALAQFQTVRWEDLDMAVEEQR